MNQELKELFKGHLDSRLDKINNILDELELDGLVIDAGKEQYFFEDDQTQNFRTSHHFNYLCPEHAPASLLVLKKGEKPKFFGFRPVDFWHETAVSDEGIWQDQYDVSWFAKDSEVDEQLKQFKSFAYMGPDSVVALDAGLKVNVPGLKERLNWERSFKTPYEMACMRQATSWGANGHKKAKEAFLSGGSEYEIHLAFLQGTQQTDDQLPYHTIVCLNEKGAILHYHKKRHQRNGQSLLIDAGARFLGYGSDITRTYAADSAHPVFKSLVQDMERAQIELVQSAKVGDTFVDMHERTHHLIANLLKDHEIIKGMSVDEMVASDVTKVFFPHGFGHMLGLLVHDVAGKQSDPYGTPTEVDPKHPNLRSQRVIDEGFLFTVEPGLYFIDMLLDGVKGKDHASQFNWDLIEALKPFGGIRIEDNVAIINGETVNMTREVLP